MMAAFVSAVSNLFLRARTADTKHFRRLSELGEAIEELPYSASSSDIVRDPEDVTPLIALCHDGHQLLLLEAEQRLHEAIEKWKQDFLEKFRKRERKRNRDRILELNHFIDTMRQDEDELDILPVAQFQLGEGILVD